jgi:hypothetical protein
MDDLQSMDIKRLKALAVGCKISLPQNATKVRTVQIITSHLYKWAIIINIY